MTSRIRKSLLAVVVLTGAALLLAGCNAGEDVLLLKAGFHDAAEVKVPVGKWTDPDLKSQLKTSLTAVPKLPAVQAERTAAESGLHLPETDELCGDVVDFVDDFGSDAIASKLNGIASQTESETAVPSLHSEALRILAELKDPNGPLTSKEEISTELKVFGAVYCE